MEVPTSTSLMTSLALVSAPLRNMGKPIAPVVVPPGPLDMLQDALLFNGDFGWMFYFSLIGFCAANARAGASASPSHRGPFLVRLSDTASAAFFSSHVPFARGG